MGRAGTEKREMSNMPKKIRKRAKRVCYYCTNKVEPNYKMVDNLRRMTTDRGKIVPRRLTGTCARHQRKLALAVKQARYLAMVPFVAENLK
jgi:small subunit ribosomal protein S18